MKNKLEYRTIKIRYVNYVYATINLTNGKDSLWKFIKIKPYKNTCIYLTTSMIMFESM